MLVPVICQQKRGGVDSERREFRPEAAVNPGNSGGPVLNEASKIARFCRW